MDTEELQMTGRQLCRGAAQLTLISLLVAGGSMRASAQVVDEANELNSDVTMPGPDLTSIGLNNRGRVRYARRWF
jgi:hypothetical protein